MFENLLIGPICVIYNNGSKHVLLKEVEINGYIPFIEIKKGEFFDRIKQDMDTRRLKVTSVLTSIGFIKLYTA